MKIGYNVFKRKWYIKLDKLKESNILKRIIANIAEAYGIYDLHKEYSKNNIKNNTLKFIDMRL